MDLKWLVLVYRDIFVLWMGGLYIVMNFMKCIGDYMSGFGLYEFWMECELLGLIVV